MPLELAKIFLSFLKKIPRELYIPILIAIFGLTFFGYGLIHFFGSNNDRENNDQPQIFTITPNIAQQKKITVDIEGSISKPGVYTLSLDSRVQDGLIAAGGLSNDADREYVEKQMNLAAKLVDGGKIYIPHKGEVTNSNVNIQNVQGVNNQTSNSIININIASASELEALPGIGQVTAQKIINGRPYQTAEELLAKKVVSQKIYDAIKTKINAM